MQFFSVRGVVATPAAARSARIQSMAFRLTSFKLILKLLRTSRHSPGQPLHNPAQLSPSIKQARLQRIASFLAVASRAFRLRQLLLRRFTDADAAAADVPAPAPAPAPTLIDLCRDGISQSKRTKGFILKSSVESLIAETSVFYEAMFIMPSCPRSGADAGQQKIRIEEWDAVLDCAERYPPALIESLVEKCCAVRLHCSFFKNCTVCLLYKASPALVRFSNMRWLNSLVLR